MEIQALECGDPAVGILESVEAESQRIARELHDAVGQELAAASLFAAGLQKILERALRRSQHNGHAAQDDACQICCRFDSGEVSQLIETLNGIRRRTRSCVMQCPRSVSWTAADGVGPERSSPSPRRTP
ncbi:MAG UNVERIFIED_CONTAM: histidine kinase [Planctomycetaceae bacterium]|jgi:signal transduction histidine kinase